MRVSYMEPGCATSEEGLVSREFPDYKTDDRGEPSDASAEEVRTYAAHHFCGCCCVNLQRLQHCIGYGAPVRLLQGPSCRVSAAAMAEVALIVQTVKNRCEVFKTQLFRWGVANLLCSAFGRSLVCYMPLARRAAHIF